MKTLLSCSKCRFPDDTTAPIPDHRTPTMWLSEMRDDGIYELRCERGHVTFTMIQNLAFELLFDSGALALRDGYLRESVASCAGALEDFYAFYVRVVLRAHEVSGDVIDRFAKDTRLSERRLGAMHFAYAIENKTPFTLDEQKRREFRNNVIHSGYWPSSDEAREYVAHVYETIWTLAHPLRERHPEAFEAETVAHLTKAYAEARRRAASPPGAERPRYGTMASGTLLGLSMMTERTTFEKAFGEWNDGNVWDIAREAERGDPSEPKK